MSALRRREIVIAIMVFFGFLMFFSYFISGIKELTGFVTDVQKWVTIMSAIALGLGFVNLTIIHANHIRRKTPGQWPFSIWLIGFMYFFSFVGIFLSTNSSEYQWLFNNIYTPLNTWIYSLTCFFIFSAAYRAFRVRSLEAMVLMVSAFLTMFRNTPILPAFNPIFSDMGKFVMDVPVTAVMRGIIIAAGVGAVAFSLRILLGFEKGALGEA